MSMRVGNVMHCRLEWSTQHGACAFLRVMGLIGQYRAGLRIGWLGRDSDGEWAWAAIGVRAMRRVTLRECMVGSG